MYVPAGARPLIIVGRQRAGTRFLTNALSQFPGVSIQGEIPQVALAQMLSMVNKVDAYHRRRRVRGGQRAEECASEWLGRKKELIYACWHGLSQGRAVPASEDCRYFGYKRPGDEHLFDFYERHLAEDLPVYLYCCRNFTDNYLSVSSRWPRKGIRRVAREYLSSVRQFRYMKQMAPDRVFAFVLDDLEALGVDYFANRILSQLHIDPDPSILRKLASRKPDNSAASLGVARRRHLTRWEKWYLARKTKLADAFGYVRRNA